MDRHRPYSRFQQDLLLPFNDGDDGAPGGSTGAEPRDDALPAGTRLEEFVIERIISGSGFGLVYLATDEALARRIAIKEYLPGTLAMRSTGSAQLQLRAPAHGDAFDRGMRAFIEESRLLARCQHASLVHVLRSWEANGTAYRAMSYYPGTSLLSLRQAMGSPPDEATLRGLIDGLLDALQVLHEAGALHREVTPANIVLLPDDRPVLLDTSAARRAIMGDEARALLTLLSPAFAPQEQTSPAPDRSQGPWTDLYALAAVVKYCISGELPPPASPYRTPPRESVAAMVQRLGARHAQPHYSASFVRAIDAALSPHIEDRPATVAAFRAMLNDHPPASGAEGGEPEAWGMTLPREDDGPTLSPLDSPAPSRTDVPASAAKPTNAAPAWPTDPPFPALEPTTASRAEPAFGTAPSASATPVSVDDTHAARRTGDVGTPQAGPVLAYVQKARRRRRRVAWTSAALVVIAAGVAAWMLDQQRLGTLAEAGFARAARQDGLTTNLPSLAQPQMMQRDADSMAAGAAASAAAVPAAQTAASSTATAPAALQALPPETQTTAAVPPASMSSAANDGAPMASTHTGQAGAATSSAGTEATAPLATEHPIAQPGNPRAICGERTQFALYRCMQTQCDQPQWKQHPQCKRFRVRDDVD